MAFEAQIFIPSVKRRMEPLTKITAISVIFFILIGIAISESDNIIWLKNILTGFLAIIASILVAISVASYKSHALLNGVLKGELIINENEIIINNTKVSVKSIKSINFFLEDYYEKNINTTVSFLPKLSQGVGNKISFETNTNQHYEVFFKLRREIDRKDLNPFIASIIKHKIIDFNYGIELMQLSTKEEIDELRKILLS